VSRQTLNLTNELYAYLLDVSLREADILRRLREETAPDPFARYQISPEQGQFMMLLIELLGARNALEIGVYTGYSSLCVALALPADGHLVACDISREWTDVASRYWDQAGVSDKIELKLGPAMDSMDELLANGWEGGFDFIFIDADKQGYDGYYERALKLLRPGGLIALDNMLRSGRVLNPDKSDADTHAIHALNEKLKHDERVSLSMVPIADGLTLARKRSRI